MNIYYLITYKMKNIIIRFIYLINKQIKYKSNNHQLNIILIYINFKYNYLFIIILLFKKIILYLIII